MQRIGFIDSWRFVAVALVIGAHLVGWHGADPPTLELTATYALVAVFIFFFISGYVVSRGCLEELREGTFSAPDFYVRRAFRILPPLALYLATLAALGVAGVLPVSADELLPAATNTCNTHLFDCGWYAGHTWSLAFEEQFYLVFPLAIGAATLRRGGLLALTAMFAALPLLFPVHWIGRTGFAIIYGLFAAGYLSARFGERLPSLRWPTAAFTLAAALTFFPVPLFESTPLSRDYKFIYVLSIPLMVLSTGHARFALRGLLELRLVQYIGRASYSIYLWQQLLTGPVFRDLPIAAHVALIICSIPVLLALFEYVERPLIAFGRTAGVRVLARVRPIRPVPA